MIHAHTADTVRRAEEPLLAAGVPLMDRAAFALSRAVLRELVDVREGVVGGRVVLLVGSGNNGGDALFAGAALRRRGVAVEAYGLGSSVHGPGLQALRRAGGTFVDASRTDTSHGLADLVDRTVSADVVLDAIVGTGARGPLRGVGARVVEALAGRLDGRGGARGPRVVAVDLPSGIGVDDGTIPGAVLSADVTVTFAAPQPGLLLPPAASVVGRVRVVDIGLGLPDDASGVLRRLAPQDVGALWPTPGASDQKYTRGVVGLVAGTSHFPGAAVLAASGAVRAGAGMVRYVGPEAVAEAVVAARPEVVPARGRVQAWALGPGLPAADARGAAHGDPGDPAADAPSADVLAQHGAVREALAAHVPAVVDAGALSLVPDRCPPSVVLTPHAGELATFLRVRGHDVDRAAVERSPLEHARLAHDLCGATVLLKGAVTVVVGAEGSLWSQADAPAWLATAGAGDVLTGILGALLAGRSEDVLAEPALAARLAAAAALVHGFAAHAANPGGPIAALDVAGAVPRVVAELLRDGLA